MASPWAHGVSDSFLTGFTFHSTRSGGAAVGVCTGGKPQVFRWWWWAESASCSDSVLLRWGNKSPLYEPEKRYTPLARRTACEIVQEIIRLVDMTSHRVARLISDTLSSVQITYDKWLANKMRFGHVTSCSLLQFWQTTCFHTEYYIIVFLFS